MFLNNLNKQELMNEDPLLKELGYSCVVMADGSAYFVALDMVGNRRIICEFGRFDSMYKAIWSDLPRQRAKWEYVNKVAKEHNQTVNDFFEYQKSEGIKELLNVARRYVGASERVAFSAED